MKKTVIKHSITKLTTLAFRQVQQLLVTRRNSWYEENEGHPHYLGRSAYIDEVFVEINGKLLYLWRAFEQYDGCPELPSEKGIHPEGVASQ